MGANVKINQILWLSLVATLTFTQPAQARPSPPSIGAVLSAYGAKENPGGTFSFTSQIKEAGATPIELANLLSELGLSDDIRAIMYATKKCAARAYQDARVTTASGEIYHTVYPCDGQCSTYAEYKNRGGEVSERTQMPESFCAAIWGGGIPLKDLHGL